jgi:hypothetical protein
VPLEWQDAVIRAAITLKLCQFEETGAIVAAMTTSIPEAPNTQRNWDYRYCWLRDAFFVVRALNSLSEVGTMEDYLRWLNDVVRSARGGHVQPLYGIGLEQTLTESFVPHLSGYRGMGPVRTGNQAFEHIQYDVYGNILLGAAQAFFDHRLFRRPELRDFLELEGMGEQAWRFHDQPDAGMWELRTRARVHTSSSLMCWAACDRLAKIAAVLGQERAHGVLARPRRRDPPQDPRAVVEREAAGLRRELRRQGPRRRRPADGRGRLHRPEGPALREDGGALESTLCRRPVHAPLRGARRLRQARDGVQRVLVLAHRRAGPHRPHGAGARDLRVAARAPQPRRAAVGGPARGERRAVGNFPQTYSMVGVINGAVRLSRRGHGG